MQRHTDYVRNRQTEDDYTDYSKQVVDTEGSSSPQVLSNDQLPTALRKANHTCKPVDRFMNVLWA